MTKKKIANHYRGRRYAKKRWPATFAMSQNALDVQRAKDAGRFIEAITMAYAAGVRAGLDEAFRMGA